MNMDQEQKNQIIGLAVIVAALLGMLLMIVAIVSTLRQPRQANPAPEPPVTSRQSSDADAAILSEPELAAGELIYARLAGVDLAGRDLASADLALADLSGARLAGADLSGAMLEGATLREADLTDAELIGSDLSYADLRRARLIRANLEDAVLAGADLRVVDLTDADLTGADLSGANLSQAVLDGTILTDVVADSQTVWPPGYVPPGLLTSAPPAMVELDLPLEVGISSAILPAYAALAATEDTARADFPADYHLLPQVETGARMAVFKSAALAQQLVPRMVADLDIIGYNLEHGPLNPAAEQADPVAAVAALRRLADEYGLELAVGPDHDFALSHGTDLAPYADRFVLQIQAVQHQPAVARDFVLPLAEALRTANPDLALYVQVRADGGDVGLARLLESLAPRIDGVSILTRPDGAAEFVSLARAVGSTVHSGEGSVAADIADDPASATAGDGPQVWTLVGALLVQLLVIGLLGAVAVAVFRNA